MLRTDARGESLRLVPGLMALAAAFTGRADSVEQAMEKLVDVSADGLS